MAILELTVKVPEAVARDAEAIGLLQPEAMERMLREEIRRRRQERLFNAADRLAGLNQAPLTEGEVAAEIQAARSERRGGRARGD
jgi:hypothetical protein